MKPLLPSLKEKKRYVVFEVISDTPIKKMPIDCIKNAMIQLYGEVGLGEAGLIFLKNKWFPNKQRGLIRVNHKYVDKLKGSFCFINKIERKKIIIKSVGVSGTLKNANLKYLG